MGEQSQRDIQANGITLRVTEQGSGPLTRVSRPGPPCDPGATGVAGLLVGAMLLLGLR
jgi:hypothetical protein